MLSLESVIGILFNSVVGYIVDYHEVDDLNIAYFWVTGFLTVLIFISFLNTIGLAIYDKEFDNVLTAGFEEEIEKVKKEESKLGIDISKISNRSFYDDLKERSFISGKRVRVHSKT